MSEKPCPKCGRSNSVVKSTGGYWACDTCDYEEPMSETMTDPISILDLLAQLNATLDALSERHEVRVYKVENVASRGVMIVIADLSAANGRVIGTAK